MTEERNTAAVQALNQLIATCKDAENGFRTAADGVKISDVKKLFDTYSAQRARFAVELQAEVERLGGKPVASGSWLGTMHRGWINIKSLVTGRDEGAIFGECRAGEAAALKIYEEALTAGLPEESAALVRRQLVQVKEAWERVGALLDAAAKV